jgi:heme/copper-type cytochrome/quinol oxidase subunit 2
LSNGEDGREFNVVLPIGLAILEILITLAGIVAVVMVIYASFKFVLSQGEPDKAAGARKTAINAAIGLVIVIVATRVVSFIATRLTS